MCFPQTAWDHQSEYEKSDNMCALSISQSAEHFCLCVLSREAFSSVLRILHNKTATFWQADSKLSPVNVSGAFFLYLRDTQTL